MMWIIEDVRQWRMGERAFQFFLHRGDIDASQVFFLSGRCYVCSIRDYSIFFKNIFWVLLTTTTAMTIAYHAVAQRARLTETRAPAPFIIKDKKKRAKRNRTTTKWWLQNLSMHCQRRTSFFLFFYPRNALCMFSIVYIQETLIIYIHFEIFFDRINRRYGPLQMFFFFFTFFFSFLDSTDEKRKERKVCRRRHVFHRGTNHLSTRLSLPWHPPPLQHTHVVYTPDGVALDVEIKI